MIGGSDCGEFKCSLPDWTTRKTSKLARWNSNCSAENGADIRIVVLTMTDILIVALAMTDILIVVLTMDRHSYCSTDDGQTFLL